MKIIIKYIFEVIWNYPLRKSWQMHTFLLIAYYGVRRHFALDAIVFLVNWFWQLDFKWTKTKFFVFIMHSKSRYG